MKPEGAPQQPVSAEGVDLTQIRALKRMTPAERLAALKRAANNLLALRRNARRVGSTDPQPQDLALPMRRDAPDEPPASS